MRSAVGISRAAFYSYFPSKEELLRRMYNQVISSTQTALERIAAEDLPVQEKLRRITRHHVHYLATHMPLAQVFFSELFNLPPEMERSVTQANRAFGQVIEKVVEEGVNTGVLIPGPPQAVYLCPDRHVELDAPLVSAGGRVDAGHRGRRIHPHPGVRLSATPRRARVRGAVARTEGPAPGGGGSADESCGTSLRTADKADNVN